MRAALVRPGGAYGGGVGEVEVLLIGGRSGVGKTAVGYEVCEVLAAAEVAHVLIDGDNLDACYPKPAGDRHGTALTEANLGALWANYAAAGQRRVVYVNTVAVLEAPIVVRAVGGNAQVVAVLLTAGDDVVAQRLAAREIGSALERHVQRSATMAAHLQDQADPSVVRVATGGRTVVEIAADVVAATGWTR